VSASLAFPIAARNGKKLAEPVNRGCVSRRSGARFREVFGALSSVGGRPVWPRFLGEGLRPAKGCATCAGETYSQLLGRTCCPYVPLDPDPCCPRSEPAPASPGRQVGCVLPSALQTYSFIWLHRLHPPCFPLLLGRSYQKSSIFSACSTFVIIPDLLLGRKGREPSFNAHHRFMLAVFGLYGSGGRFFFGAGRLNGLRIHGWNAHFQGAGANPRWLVPDCLRRARWTVCYAAGPETHSPGALFRRSPISRPSHIACRLLQYLSLILFRP